MVTEALLPESSSSLVADADSVAVSVAPTVASTPMRTCAVWEREAFGDNSPTQRHDVSSQVAPSLPSIVNGTSPAHVSVMSPPSVGFCPTFFTDKEYSITSPGSTVSAALNVAFNTDLALTVVFAGSLTEVLKPSSRVAEASSSVPSVTLAATPTLTLSSPPPASGELPAGTFTFSQVMVRPDCVPSWLMPPSDTDTSAGNSSVSVPSKLDDDSLWYFRR